MTTTPSPSQRKVIAGQLSGLRDAAVAVSQAKAKMAADRLAIARAAAGDDTTVNMDDANLHEAFTLLGEAVEGANFARKLEGLLPHVAYLSVDDLEAYLVAERAEADARLEGCRITIAGGNLSAGPGMRIAIGELRATQAAQAALEKVYPSHEG